MFTLVVDELLGGRIVNHERVRLAVFHQFILLFGRKVVDVIQPAVFSALHLLDEHFFGIIGVVCHNYSV